uniref:Uncharacterized protein n=1 Tax=Lepeophtheirus salmonis TaxID=72036 RepID=A0A0K2UJP1_LEPSM
MPQESFLLLNHTQHQMGDRSLIPFDDVIQNVCRKHNNPYNKSKCWTLEIHIENKFAYLQLLPIFV